MENKGTNTQIEEDVERMETEEMDNIDSQRTTFDEPVRSCVIGTEQRATEKVGV